MSEDSVIEKLISQGVSPEIRFHQKRFQYCNRCRDPFNEKNMRTLLNCGHFTCIDCFDDDKKCWYPGCGNKNASVKQFNLKTNQPSELDSIFRFGIAVGDSSRIITKEVKGSTTLAELIDEYLAHKFIENYGQKQVIVIIGCKSKTYDKIKDIRIFDLQEMFGFTSTKSKASAVHIMINSRYHSGKACLDV